MLSNHFGHLFDRPLSSLAKTVDVNPNIITIAGFFITAAAAVTLSYDLLAGGILILVGGFFDMFDGIIARTNKRSTEFGAFLDSVMDRYSDSFLFLGLAAYFLKHNSITGMSLSLGSMVGALIISYARARAEGLGKECHTGLMERPDRIILMALGALTGLIVPAMWIMLVLTHFTVIQRIYHVWKVTRRP